MSAKNCSQLVDAITYERFEVAKNLLIAGCGANELDEFGQTALFRIVYNRTSNELDFLQLFISHGADVNFRKRDGTTPIFFARGDALKLLLREGADVSLRSVKGRSPLHHVTTLEDLNILYEIGLDINERDIELNVPLHNYLYGDEAIVKFCVENGADLNAKDFIGRTPLMFLARSEYVMKKNELPAVKRKAQYLIKGGADVKTKDNQGLAAYDHANLFNNHDFANWLESYAAK